MSCYPPTTLLYEQKLKLNGQNQARQICQFKNKSFNLLFKQPRFMKNHNILLNILQMFSKIVVFTQSALSELQEKALVIWLKKKGQPSF